MPFLEMWLIFSPRPAEKKNLLEMSHGWVHPFPATALLCCIRAIPRILTAAFIQLSALYSYSLEILFQTTQVPFDFQKLLLQVSVREVRRSKSTKINLMVNSTVKMLRWMAGKEEPLFAPDHCNQNGFPQVGGKSVTILLPVFARTPRRSPGHPLPAHPAL